MKVSSDKGGGTHLALIALVYLLIKNQKNELNLHFTTLNRIFGYYTSKCHYLSQMLLCGPFVYDIYGEQTFYS